MAATIPEYQAPEANRLGHLAGVGTSMAEVDDEEGEQEEETDPSTYFHVINAFDMPRWQFDADRKAFNKAPTKPTILARTSASKAAFLRDRHNILKHVVLRNENFSPPLAYRATRDRGNYMKLTSTKNLLGRQGQRFLLFGMLCQAQDGRYALEDVDGMVVLDLDEAVPGEGIFTEGSFVLVEGEYTHDETIKVYAIGHPPSEPRKVARGTYAHLDFLGLGPLTPADESRLLRINKQQYEQLAIVVISDLHLDHPTTLQKFRTMLEGYEDAGWLPFAFVLCGNFSSRPWTGRGEDMDMYRDNFTALADLLQHFPTILSTTHFIFVPGANDPFPSSALPRPAIPDFFTSKLRAKVPRARFASNPARLMVLGQEIVLFREDLMSRMLRNTVRLKEETSAAALKRYLVSTVLDQAHLCPLPVQVKPVLWEYDHALRLYPMPSALVLADKYDRFELTYEGCHVFNPGPFRGSSFGFTTFYPATGRAERSELS